MIRHALVGHKVKLIKLHDNGEEQVVASGHILTPIEKGNQVWVGSITSQDGWRTTPIQKLSFKNKRIQFSTLNSNYEIRKLDE